MDTEDIQYRYIVFGEHQNLCIQFTYIVFEDDQNTYIQIHFLVHNFFLELAFFLLLRKAERDCWQNIPLTINHQPDRIVTLYKYFVIKAIYSF